MTDHFEATTLEREHAPVACRAHLRRQEVAELSSPGLGGHGGEGGVAVWVWGYITASGHCVVCAVLCCAVLCGVTWFNTTTTRLSNGGSCWREC